MEKIGDQTHAAEVLASIPHPSALEHNHLLSRSKMGPLNLARRVSRIGRPLQRCFSSMLDPAGAIDVHTHMYLPKYMDILRKRADVPYIRDVDGESRLVILPGEDQEKSTAIGRPIGREYYDVQAKLQFMDNHGISRSVISLANPWLDFLEGDTAEAVAQELNDELQDICEASNERLLGFATLPVRNQKASLRELDRLSSLSHVKGVILGTPGAGDGLDHDNMRDVLASIEEKGLLIFLHPHYGAKSLKSQEIFHSCFALRFQHTYFHPRRCRKRTLSQQWTHPFPGLGVSFRNHDLCVAFNRDRYVQLPFILDLASYSHFPPLLIPLLWCLNQLYYHALLEMKGLSIVFQI